MKTKTVSDLTSMYDALRLLIKAKAALFAGQEPLLAGRVGGLARELEITIETFEVVESRLAIQNAMLKG